MGIDTHQITVLIRSTNLSDRRECQLKSWWIFVGSTENSGRMDADPHAISETKTNNYTKMMRQTLNKYKTANKSHLFEEMVIYQVDSSQEDSTSKTPMMLVMLMTTAENNVNSGTVWGLLKSCARGSRIPGTLR